MRCCIRAFALRRARLCRSPHADLEFWEGRSDLLEHASGRLQLFLAQRHHVRGLTNIAGANWVAVHQHRNTENESRNRSCCTHATCLQRSLSKSTCCSFLPFSSRHGCVCFPACKGNATQTAKCMRVTTVSNCKLKMVKGMTSVSCT